MNNILHPSRHTLNPHLQSNAVDLLKEGKDKSAQESEELVGGLCVTLTYDILMTLWMHFLSMSVPIKYQVVILQVRMLSVVQ